MNKTHFYSFAITVAIAIPWLSVTSHASLGGEVPAMLQNADGGTLGLDGVYTVTRTKQVMVKSYTQDGKTYGTDGDKLGYNLESDVPVGVEHLKNGDVRLSFASVESEEEQPTSITVSANEFRSFDLAFKSEGGQDDLQKAYEDFASIDSENASRGKHVVVHKRKRGYAGWGDGGCVNYIKRVTGCHKPLGNGRVAAYGLIKQCGFHPVSCASKTPGMIVQWSRGAGHVAQYEGDGCYHTDVPVCSAARKYGDPDMGPQTLCVDK